jgi:spermidine synthase
MGSTQPPPIHDGSRWIILLLFVVSGVCGLIYEVVWTKQFVAIFGNTVFAASTVLAAYMAGLGLGSVLLGRFADRRADCLRIYGYLEILIGIGAALVPLAMLGVEWLYVAFDRRFDPSLGLLTFVRFALSFLVVLIPATLMGGTLPVLSRHMVTQLGTAGRKIGSLYALNTFGAFLGTMAAGFLLIRLFGLHRTTAIAVCLNLLVGIIALTLHRRVKRSAAATRQPDVATSQTTTDISDGAIRLCMLGLGVSGFTALAYEVIFFRGLELVIGTTVYAFATMLATFLAGIAIGSALVSLIVDRIRLPILWLGTLQILIALSVLGSAALLTKLPMTYLHLYAAGVQTWTGLLAIKFTTSFLLLLMPSMLLGATFPVVTRAVTHSTQCIGATVGHLYLFNTMGAILGSVAAGFVLVPLLGIYGSLLAVLALNLILGVVFVWFEPAPSRLTKLGSAGLAIATAVLLTRVPAWNPAIMTSGVYLGASGYIDERGDLGAFERTIAQRELLYYREGLTATVAVHRTMGHRALSINGKTVASNSYNDMRLQRSIGHLPMLLCPNPKDVLVIGLGTGVTAGSCARHPGARVEIVEIEQAVLQAARWFSPENRFVLDSPQVQVVINDGRNHLLTTLTRYDVITADPIHPLAAGSSNLFSREFYTLCRDALKPKGVMCQWLPLYGLSQSDLSMVMATFQTVFAHTSVWLTGGDVALIGTAEPLDIDATALATRLTLEAVRGDLEELHLADPYALVSRIVLGANEVRKITVDARINTDEHLHLEYSAPRNMFSKATVESNLAWLLKESIPLLSTARLDAAPNQPIRLIGFSKQRLDRFVKSRDEVILGVIARPQDPQAALQHFRRALSINPEDRDASNHIAELLAAARGGG